MVWASRPELPRQDGQRATSGVRRPTEQVLRHDVDASPSREQHRSTGDVRGVDGDVHRGVAHPDHQDPSIPENLGNPVVVCVQLRSREGPRIARVGPARIPVVTVRHHGCVVRFGVAGLGADVPAVAGALHAADRAVEANAREQVELLGVVG
ncbi:MAG: hypothetical protein ABIO67_03600, partial [Mycobacteriales bacterium]